MENSRRRFLKQSLLATTGTMLVPQFLKAWENPGQESPENILVVIQFSGGNDGLNTVVPFADDLYHKYRPQLGLSQNRVLKLSDAVGLNDSLAKIKALYDDGVVGICNSVGYPNPDRSHFRSMDIWQTASRADEIINTGWIGRYLDSQCDGCGPHTAIEIDDTLSLAMKGKQVKGMAVRNPEKLYRAAHAPFFKSIGSPDDEENVAYLYKTLAETISNSEYLYDKSKIYKTGQPYPDTAFANQLKTIGSLIGSGIKTRVYYASLSGFDTHVSQAGAQERLLKIYAEAVFAFMSDLKTSGNQDRVMMMTFSEFGRRVSENASGGTDHGTANNVILIGKKLKRAGLFNGPPDLSTLDNGDLVYQVDFRNIYATLLKNWLAGDPGKIINPEISMLDFV
jgi:uncharacterized protein (DUF1501 family)